VLSTAVAISLVQDERDDLSPRSKRLQALKADAVRAVGYRESLIVQLNAVVLHWPRDSDDSKKKRGRGAMTRNDAHRQSEAARLLTNVSVELRQAGLSCVEKVTRALPEACRGPCAESWRSPQIVAWALEVGHDHPADDPPEFVWAGVDYLTKMFADLDFVAQQLGKVATWPSTHTHTHTPLRVVAQRPRCRMPGAWVTFVGEIRCY
jgi:hypothetical protein